MDSTDDSQSDIFATQAPPKKKVFKTSSAPPYRPSAHVQDLEYKWIIIFKWGGDIDFPFELVPVDRFGSDDLNSSFLSGILSPLSRLKHREMSAYPDFSVSIFAKVEKSTSTPLSTPFFTYIILCYIITSHLNREHFGEKEIDHLPIE